MWSNIADEWNAFVNLGEKETQNGQSNNMDISSLDSRANDNRSTEQTKEVNGGSGSGNFGHSGRPGEVGGSQGVVKEEGDKYIVEIEVVNPMFPVSKKIFDDKPTAIRYASGYRAGLEGRKNVPTLIEETDGLYHLAYEDRPKLIIPGTKEYKTREEVETVRAGFNDARDYKKERQN